MEASMCETHASRLESWLMTFVDPNDRVQVVELSTEEKARAAQLRFRAQLLRESSLAA